MRSLSLILSIVIIIRRMEDTSGTVLHDVSDEGILTITLNNPKKLNAIDNSTYT